MKYVLDGSVGLKWAIVEQDSDKAIRLREDFRNAIHKLIAPESFSIECANSLTKKVRQRIISDDLVAVLFTTDWHPTPPRAKPLARRA